MIRCVSTPIKKLKLKWHKVFVAPIVGKLVEYCLRWFGHVWRKFVKVPGWRADQMEDDACNS